jgi:predicted O-methyltransferase YrrM
VALDDLIEDLDSVPVTVLDFQYEFGGINTREMFALCRLARSRAPRAVFEVGTYLGMTTRQLAANTEATIYTLDLPPKGHPDHVETAYWGQPEQPGASFQGTPEADRIVQLYGDSQTYDFSAHAGTMDFVFVDATHEYDEVKRDSRSALEVLAPGGLILWHDYQPHFSGLVRALEELNTEVPIMHLGGTSLALHEREPAG